MRQVPICEVIRRIKVLSPRMQQEHVAALIKIEKAHTKRRAELEALAFSICFPLVGKAARQIKRERRAKH